MSAAWHCHVCCSCKILEVCSHRQRGAKRVTVIRRDGLGERSGCREAACGEHAAAQPQLSVFRNLVACGSSLPVLPVSLAWQHRARSADAHHSCSLSAARQHEQQGTIMEDEHVCNQDEERNPNPAVNHIKERVQERKGSKTHSDDAERFIQETNA